MRGTVRSPDRELPCYRFIPAHAGNGWRWPACPSCWSVHPRACEERSALICRTFGNSGSSPRVRGTAGRAPRRIKRKRFIPAHAGNGLRRGRARDTSTVHPRACGERCGLCSIGNSQCGSSPRMRGTACPAPSSQTRPRFIPAHAGNGRQSRVVIRPASVHPRACGERGVQTVFPVTFSGSSPRMRGTAPKPRRPQARPRFIPAHAGNGEPASSAEIARAVHPRACGERDRRLILTQFTDGSSPRMRGTDPARHSNPPGYRFIPAHAGNGLRAAQPDPSGAVHPRACGERGRKAATSASAIGSSPRMRGTGSCP